MRERDVEAYLVKRVRELGGECRKVQWIGRVGAPDRLVMLPAVWQIRKDNTLNWLRYPTIWVELKAPGEKARPSQVREHERMRAMGQRVVVIDSIDGVEELLA
jgi:hypothetical protein